MPNPPKFKTPQEMEAAVDEYFDKVCKDDVPTMGGLLRHLGFRSRTSFVDYSKNKKGPDGQDAKAFAPVIEYARMRASEFWERQLASGKPVGSIFWLKCNAGWQDHTEQVHRVIREETPLDRLETARRIVHLLESAGDTAKVIEGTLVQDTE